MKQREIILGAALSTFILVNISVLANIVQMETIPSSKNNSITDKINPEDLLFQTIIDITENKDIQNILGNSEFEIELNKTKTTLLIMKLFMKNPKIFFSILLPHSISSKNYIKHTYNLSLEISKTLNTSEIKSITDYIHIKNPRTKEKILTIIKGYNKLNKKIEILSNLNCGCNENISESIDWDFPIICDILGVIGIIGVFLFMTILPGLGKIIFGTAFILGEIFNCPWT